jgi:methionyl-tRNA formyltransferase
MRIIFIGTVELSEISLKKLIGLQANVVGVVTRAKSVFNADFCDITTLCAENGIPFIQTADVNSEPSLAWIRGLHPDVIFCIGWSSLLKKDIMSIPRLGVIGFHPAQVPQNRGRHPIIWTLVLGLEKTASTFFFMDEGADSGDILSQTIIAVTYDDNARTLYNKITEVVLKQLEDLLPKLVSNSYLRIPQDNSQANYWRKRTEKDGEIDFRMTSKAIYNLVRALDRPYPGAHIAYKGRTIKVWSVKEMEIGMPNIEYGKVIDTIDKGILVKCYDGGVLLSEHEFIELPKTGEYLL